jgi:hypothetical protein
MKHLSDSASERINGGSLVSLNIPISVNNLIGPQVNAAAVAAVAPLGGNARAMLGQGNDLNGRQRIVLPRRR